MRTHICTFPEYCWDHLQDKVKRLERFKDALPAIVFALAYFDFDEDADWERCLKAWEIHFKPALQEEHGGDCTNECYSCARCQAERCVKLAGIIEEGLSDERSKPSGPDSGGSTDGG